MAPAFVWSPDQRNAGISLCAGEVGLPSEKTSETVPSSAILPPAQPGFVELYTALHAPYWTAGILLYRLVALSVVPKRMSLRTARIRQCTVPIHFASWWSV